MIFTGVWAIVKGFLDEKTRNKITIKGGKFEKDLLELVEPENLPKFLGGKCTCDEFGGCMKSGVGPWDDYEIIQPVGIRRKQGADSLAIKDSKEEEKKNHH
jgi:hypothetical protein